jgi:hypothetical protein
MMCKLLASCVVWLRGFLETSYFRIGGDTPATESYEQIDLLHEANLTANNRHTGVSVDREMKPRTVQQRSLFGVQRPKVAIFLEVIEDVSVHASQGRANHFRVTIRIVG